MSDDRQQPERSFTVEAALVNGVLKPQPKIWVLTISLFVVAFWIPVLFWLFRDLPLADEALTPPSWYLKDDLEKYCMQAMIFCGSVQCWSVFSPHLNHTIYHESAVITYRDGSSKIYEFPRMSKLSYWERFKHEKLRKVFGDCIPWPGYEPFLPSVARFLALSNCDRNNQPEIVSFVFNSAINPRPDRANWNYRDNLPFHTDKSITFVYSVRDSDLNASRKDMTEIDPKPQDGTI